MFRLILFIFLIGLSGICVSAQNQPVEKLSQVTAEPENKESERKVKKGKDIVEGTVKLKVTFLANGDVGDVVVLEATPSIKELKKAGLLKQAIAAAKKIKFEPPKRNGQPYSVRKIIEYKFTIY